MSGIAADGSKMLETDYKKFDYIATQPIMSFFSVNANDYIPSKDLFLDDFIKMAQKVRDGDLEPAVGKSFCLSDAIEANQQTISGVGVMEKMEHLVDAELAAFHGLW